MVAPSLVMVTSPSEDTSILSMPLGPIRESVCVRECEIDRLKRDGKRDSKRVSKKENSEIIKSMEMGDSKKNIVVNFRICASTQKHELNNSKLSHYYTSTSQAHTHLN